MIAILVAALTAAPASLSLPQQGTPGFLTGASTDVKPWIPPSVAIPWNPNFEGSLDKPKFEELAIGDFQGDLEQDAVILSDGELVTVHFLSSLQVVSETSKALPDVGSIVPYQKAGTYVLKFIYSDAAGLTSADFVGSPIARTQQPGTALMANATDMVVADVGGVDHVFGIDGLGTSVISMYEGGSGWQAGPSWHPNRRVYQYCFLDFDDSGVDDVALVVSGLYVVISETGQVLSVAVENPPSVVASVRSEFGGDQYDLLARLKSAGGGAWELECFNADITDAPVAMDFPQFNGGPDVPIVPTAMIAADFDGDELSDLAILEKTSQRIIVLLNQGPLSATHFNTEDVLFLPFGDGTTVLDNSANESVPVAVDHDGDGALDLLVLNEYGEELLVFSDIGLVPSTLESLKDSLLEGIGASGFVSDQTAYHRPGGFGGTWADRELHLAFESLPDHVFATYDYFHVQAYAVDPITGAYDLQPEFNHVFEFKEDPPMSGSFPSKQFCRLISAEAFPNPNGTESDLPWSNPPPVVFLRFRAVNAIQISPTTVRVTESSVAFKAAFSMQWTPQDPSTITTLLPYFAPLIGLSDNGLGFIVQQGELMEGAFDSTYVGAFLDRATPPPPPGPVGSQLPKPELDLAELWN